MPSVTMQEAKAAVAASPAVDFAMCVIGPSTTSPLPAGSLSPPYASAAAFVTDYGQGDAVDAVCQALTPTQDNPAPPAVSFYRTPSTVAGSYGPVTTSGVTGTAVPSANGSQVPTGTLQPWMKIVTPGALGTPGMTALASLSGGRQTALVSIGSGLTYNFPAGDGWPAGGGQAGFTLGTSTATLNQGDTFYTRTNPPSWTDSDLFTAGPPATGALAVIAESGQQFGIVVITEPVAAGDFTTLQAGLNFFVAQGKQAPLLIVRFRDPYLGSATTIASGSNGQTLPQATVHVASTAGAAPSGSFTVGADTVTYTGLTSNTYTGCAGGTGDRKSVV